MKPLKEWQKEFADAVIKKFPEDERWTEQDRLLAIIRQLADVSGAIQKEQGIFPHKDPAYDEPDARIACLMADVLILCETRHIDLEAELEKLLVWYRDPSKGVA